MATDQENSGNGMHPNDAGRDTSTSPFELENVLQTTASMVHSKHRHFESAVSVIESRADGWIDMLTLVHRGWIRWRSDLCDHRQQMSTHSSHRGRCQCRANRGVELGSSASVRGW